MHVQEMVQEVLAPQEHASGETKLNCAYPQDVPNTRSSKSYPQEATGSYESYHKYSQEVYSKWLNQE